MVAVERPLAQLLSLPVQLSVALPLPLSVAVSFPLSVAVPLSFPEAVQSLPVLLPLPRHVQLPLPVPLHLPLPQHLPLSVALPLLLPLPADLPLPPPVRRAVVAGLSLAAVRSAGRVALGGQLQGRGAAAATVATPGGGARQQGLLRLPVRRGVDRVPLGRLLGGGLDVVGVVGGEVGHHLLAVPLLRNGLHLDLEGDLQSNKAGTPVNEQLFNELVLSHSQPHRVISRSSQPHRVIPRPSQQHRLYQGPVNHIGLYQGYHIWLYQG